MLSMALLKENYYQLPSVHKVYSPCALHVCCSGAAHLLQARGGSDAWHGHSTKHGGVWGSQHSLPQLLHVQVATVRQRCRTAQQG